MIIADRIRYLLKENSETSRDKLAELFAHEFETLHNKLNRLEEKINVKTA
jgi:hypothetical protein